MMNEFQLREKLNEVNEEMSTIKQKVNELYLAMNKPKYKPLQNPLTPREIQVIKLICKGRASKQIADKLCIAYSTVKKHRENIAAKTGSRCAIDVMRYALVNGIIR